MNDLSQIIAAWRSQGTPGPFHSGPWGKDAGKPGALLNVYSDDGEVTVAENIVNPFDAALFAAAPFMAGRIENLEKENGQLKLVCETQAKRIAGLEEACDVIANMGHDCPSTLEHLSEEQWQRSRATQMQRIARAALKGGTDD